MDINERFALWEKKYKPHGEHEELLYIIAKDAVAALSSPHPEEREEDIEAIRKALMEARTRIAGYAVTKEWPWDKAIADLWHEMQRMDAAVKDALASLSRLAAPKPEGQAFTVEQVGWLRVVLGRALYRVEHFPEQSNDEGIEADELAKAIILLGGEPATPEPRPAKEPNHIPDVTQMVDTEPRPAAPKPEGQDCDGCFGAVQKDCAACESCKRYYADKYEATKTYSESEALAEMRGVCDGRPGFREPDGRKGE